MSQLIILRNLTKTLQRNRFILPKTYQINSVRQQQRQHRRSESKTTSLQESQSRTDVSTDVRPLGEKIKENTKTASYTAIILAGVAVTGITFWAVFRELFSSSSPNNIYSDALKRVIEHPQVQDSLGAPIKGFGEESRRGRRQHVAHSSFQRNGVPHMRMQFYVQGLRNKATVHLESRQNAAGKMEFRYLFVQLDHYPHTTIILEDNRAYDQLGQQAELSTGSLEFASYNKK